MAESDELKNSAELIRNNVIRKVGVILFAISLAKSDENSFYNERTDMQDYMLSLEEESKTLMLSVVNYTGGYLSNVCGNYTGYHNLRSKHFSTLAVLRDYFKTKYHGNLEEY